MQRLNITYSIPEDEYNEELARLLKSSEDYLNTFSSMLEASTSLLKGGNYEGCLKSVAQIRDLLAETDFRLHDSMNLIVEYLKMKDQQSSAPTENTPDTALNTNEEETKEDLNKLSERMEEARKNIKSLGIQISDDKLKELMEKANDKTG